MADLNLNEEREKLIALQLNEWIQNTNKLSGKISNIIYQSLLPTLMAICWDQEKRYTVTSKEQLPTYLKWTTAHIWGNSGDPARLCDSTGEIVSGVD